MTKLWNNPHQWDVGELNSHTKMQAVSDALEWIKDRPYDNKLVTNQGSSLTQVVTGAGNWFALSDALFTLNISTAVANERIRFDFMGIWSTTAAIANAFYWDILVDDTNYASSGTPTSSGVGLAQLVSVVAANVLQPFNVFAHYVVPTAGLHTFKLRVAGTTAQTITWYCSNANQILRLDGLDI